MTNAFSSSCIRTRLALVAAIAVTPALVVAVYTEAIERAGGVADADRLLPQHLWLAGLIMLFAIGIAWIGSEAFVLQPTKRLKHLMQQLAEGNFSVRAQLTRGAPGLMGLGDAIDAMATTLEAREHEREKADAALKANEAKCCLVMEHTPSAIFVNQGTRFVSVNAAAERLTGFSRDELLSMPFWQIAHPDSQDLVS